MTTTIENSIHSLKYSESNELEETTEYSRRLVLDSGNNYGAITSQPSKKKINSLFFENLLPKTVIPTDNKFSCLGCPIQTCIICSGFIGFTAGFMSPLALNFSLLFSFATGTNAAVCSAASCTWAIIGKSYADKHIASFFAAMNPFNNNRKSTQEEWKKYVAITSEIIKSLDAQNEKDVQNEIPEQLLDPITTSHSLRDPVCFIENPLNVYSARAIMYCIKNSKISDGKIILSTTDQIDISKIFRNSEAIRPYSIEPQQIKVMLLKKAFFEFDQSVACKDSDTEKAEQHKGNLTKIITEIEAIALSTTWEEWLKTHHEYTRPSDY